MSTDSIFEDIIRDAEEIQQDAEASSPGEKRRLLVEDCNPDLTVAALRDVLASEGQLYERGVPVRLVANELLKRSVAQVMTPDLVVLRAHEVCRPYARKPGRDGTVSEVDVRLPRPFAVMYLDWHGEWHLPPLNSIASSPLLYPDGTINSAEGYDSNSGTWCERTPNVSSLVPQIPSLHDAELALHVLRTTFRTFCFADASLVRVSGEQVPVVDVNKPPGKDESAFLAALMTSVCRPCLHLAPGALLRAAPMSGAGAGKGLLVRCICIVAYGQEPHAVTAGGNAEELEKRIAAELIEGGPALFLDNLNNMAVKSDLLASAITERPARVRILGQSRMVPINTSAFVILTGNGLSVSEDLARRFITVNLDPRTEDPEARSFSTDIRAEVSKRREELLAAALTIWRWGRKQPDLERGLPLGSFEQWCQWVRDPLLSLGCQDPALRVGEAKQRDAKRQAVADLFDLWWARHGEQPVALRDLHEDVKGALDPQGRGRQFISAQADRLVGTRIGGLVLSRQDAPGKWGVATYALGKSDEDQNSQHHRGHRHSGEPDAPDAPDAEAQQAETRWSARL